MRIDLSLLGGMTLCYGEGVGVLISTLHGGGSPSLTLFPCQPGPLAGSESPTDDTRQKENKNSGYN